MTWRKEKLCSIRRVGQRFQRQWRALSTESFDLSGNEFRAKGCNPAPEMAATPPHLPSVGSYKLPFTKLKCQHLLPSKPSSTLILSFYICKQGG